MKPLAALLILLATFANARAEPGVLVEAESFQDPGGWVLDTQFIESIGSPYLLAHGLGVPVKDAMTTFSAPAAGEYHLWVRTKDWVARWKAPGAPGKFQVLVNGQPLGPTFGTEHADWFWQDGGTVELNGKVTLALHDLTGFEGRCDAIYLAPAGAAAPPEEAQALAAWRRKVLGLSEKPLEGGQYDLVVCGGGYAGLGSALSAARMGLKVALIQDRPVLGGNGSSEVRVWAMGGIRRGLYPNLGGIVEEFTDHAKSSPGLPEEFGDAKKEEIVRAEKNISLFLNHHITEVEMLDPAHVAAVVALDTKTSARRRFAGKFFVDSTGHATVGFLAGAAFTLRETEHLGMSNMWRWAATSTAQPFPELPWALDLDLEDFPYPRHNHAEWFWEGGFNLHPIFGLEETRDWNFRAIYGAWNAMKNKGGKAEHADAKLEWIAYIGGTRESRQLIGDIVLSRDDITEKRPYPDGTVPTTWDIDLHYPKEQYAKKFPEGPFISKAIFDSRVDKQHGYPVPYRCMYSKNLENLFMAGRDISVTHEALGTVRVMKTGGMIGEVVGKAASICVKNQCTPRAVYERYFEELKTLLNQPGAARRETVNDSLVLPAGYRPLPPPTDLKEAAGLDPAKLPGLVLDDEQAQLTPPGEWSAGAGLTGFFGKGYHYRGAKGAGAATYQFEIKTAGRYEVRLSYGMHENRAAHAPVAIESAEGLRKATVNQQLEPPLQGFVSLGVFRFAPGQPARVTIGGEPADGTVEADAVQLLPQP